MQKIRQSNFELLRILCMWGVLQSHVLLYLYEIHTPEFTFAGEIRIILMNMSVLAVNCFVLISGFFRIKISMKSFFDFYFTLLFYAVLFAIFTAIFSTFNLTENFTRILFPLSESGMWFIITYLALYLISPILNKGYEHLNTRQKDYMLFLW